MHAPRFAALALAALLAGGCGDILREIDHANDLASAPSGGRSQPARSGPSAPATATREAPPAHAQGSADDGPGLVARAKAWIGLADADRPGRRPPDPNDPMVLCRLDGASGFMLKSGCINRRGTIVANKAPAH